MLVQINSDITGFRGRGRVLSSEPIDGEDCPSSEPVFCVAITDGSPLKALSLHEHSDGTHWFLHSELIWKH